MSPRNTVPLEGTSQLQVADADMMQASGAMVVQSSALVSHEQGRNPSPGSPTKEILYGEVHDLQARMYNIEAEANHAIEDTRQDLTHKAQEALSHQNAQFASATQRFEQEARDVHQLELAQTLARERGTTQNALTDASRRLRTEQQTVAQLEVRQRETENLAERAISYERLHAENIIRDRCETIVSEARRTLTSETQQSTMAQWRKETFYKNAPTSDIYLLKQK